MRKLALFCCGFSVMILAANYFSIIHFLLPAAGITLTGFCILLALHKGTKLRTVILGLMCGACCFWLNYQFTTVPVQNMDGQTLAVTVEVLSYPTEYDSYSRAEVKIRTDNYPTLRAYLYDYKYYGLTAFKPGDCFSATVKLKDSTKKYGEEYDNYRADGIYLIATLKTEPERTLLSGHPALYRLPQAVARNLRALITDIFPDTAVQSFMKALLLGDKSDLYSDDSLYVCMSRAGLMHAVAVSGMHIAFLVGVLQLMFGKNRRATIACLIFLWFFVLVTGSPVSAVRAVIMQTVLLAAPLLYRENDPLTSMSFALFLILAANPYAISGIGLQLSFGAVAGIYFIANPLTEAYRKCRIPYRIRKLLEYPAEIVICSLGVMVFTLPLMAVRFGYVTVLSPLTNILCLFAVEFCFCAGYAACLIAFVLPFLGKLAALPAALSAKYLITVVKAISGIKFAVLYMTNAVTLLWLILLYAAVLAALLMHVSVPVKILIPVAVSLVTFLFGVSITDSYYNSPGAEFTVLNVGQGECITAVSESTVIVVDCGNTFNDTDAGDIAGQYLLGCGRDSVDLLILTHLHEDHADGVIRLAQYVSINKVVIPSADYSDDEIYTKVLDYCEEESIPLQELEADTEFGYDGLKAMVYIGEGGTSENENCLSIDLDYNDFDLMITGDNSSEGEAALADRCDLSDIEAIVVGHHGSKYSASDEYLSAIGGKTAVISVGYNIYGHPTEETLNRLQEHGFKVYRTDQDNNVILKAG